MAEVQKNVVKLKIDTKGNFEMEAGEGFSGQSCVEKTRQLELVLGGVATAEGKTDAFYQPDDYNPVSINLN